jgi:transposase
VVDGETPDVPLQAVRIVGMLSQQALDTHTQLREIDRALVALRRSDDLARRLATIPGIGPVGATALAASVTDPGQFRSGRQFAAWLGLTPLQNSSGGKERLGRISKMGDKYLRKLLVVGATSLVRRAKHKPETADPRLVDLLARKPVRLATVAMANKMARIVWAVMMRGEEYRKSHAPMLAA